jgi:ribosome-associated protein
LMEAYLLESLDIARQAVEAAADKQAIDIVLLDAREVCSFADYFVICSGDSERQIPAHHREGTVDSGWMLLDFGDIIVHIFAPVERDYYQFDELWQEAKPVLRIQ